MVRKCPSKNLVNFALGRKSEGNHVLPFDMLILRQAQDDGMSCYEPAMVMRTSSPPSCEVVPGMREPTSSSGRVR